jgi:predicted TIM-barrel fold metal-dependent hydrolase
MTIHNIEFDGSTDLSAMPRREFLTRMVSLAAAILLPGCASMDQTPAIAGSSRYRIDIHHHAFPPDYVAELRTRKLANTFVSNWSVARTLDDMDKAGVATSILSVSNPGVAFADAPTARRLARSCNEYVARLILDYPGRFGSFALLPVQDIDGSLHEMEYALDVLKADGICLFTNYGDKWLGHQSFAPIMEELNRRKAVLYTHPAVAKCCGNLLPDVPARVIELGTDTTRTITDIVISGTAARCPNIRFIFSHGGGTLPFLAERLVKMPVFDASLLPRIPNGIMHELQRFYYDTAWIANPGPLASLTKLVSVSQILFGSDYPYMEGEEQVVGLIEYGFSVSNLRAIDRDNALRLLPRLRA